MKNDQRAAAERSAVQSAMTVLNLDGAEFGERFAPELGGGAAAIAWATAMLVCASGIFENVGGPEMRRIVLHEQAKL